MARKPHSPQQSKSGDDFIREARNLGAAVSDKPDRNGFFKVTTPKGSMYIAPGKDALDPRTRKNYRHWFRLLGLLMLFFAALALIDFLWGILALPPII